MGIRFCEKAGAASSNDVMPYFFMRLQDNQMKLSALIREHERVEAKRKNAA
jgi:hypothetical protein